MKRILIILFALGITAALLLGWAMFGDQSSFHEGLRQYEGLPGAASDISVYRNGNISNTFVAEFKIPELDFLTFAREEHWDAEPISGLKFVFQPKAFHDGRPNDKKEIADGLFYSKRAANGGGITVVYDRQGGRAYIYRSSR